MTPDPTRQPIYATPEDRLDIIRRNVRNATASLLETIPPIWGDDPGMVIDGAMKAFARLEGAGDLNPVERIYTARGLARAFAALKDLEKTAERAEDGALLYHAYGQVLPWTKERPHSVEEIPPFTPGPQSDWRTLADQDPDADQVASPPAAHSARSGEKGPPSGSPEGRRRTAPKLARTISFNKPEDLDATTEEGKQGILALVVRAIYPTMDNLLLQWIVLKLGTTLPDGTPRFDSAWVTEFDKKKVHERISITADEKFTSELALLRLHAPDPISLIGAEVHRNSVGMYYIVGAEFGAFLAAITGGAGLGLLASEGGTVAMEGAAMGLEGLGAESFGGFVGQGVTSLGMSAQASYAVAAPYLTASMTATTAYYGMQSAFEGHFREWSSETMNDLAEQYFAFHASGLHYTPSEPEAQGAPPEPATPGARAAGDIAAKEIQVPPATAETTYEASTPPQAATATTEQVTSPPAAAATTEQTAGSPINEFQYGEEQGIAGAKQTVPVSDEPDLPPSQSQEIIEDADGYAIIEEGGKEPKSGHKLTHTKLAAKGGKKTGSTIKVATKKKPTKIEGRGGPAAAKGTAIKAKPRAKKSTGSGSEPARGDGATRAVEERVAQPRTPDDEFAEFEKWLREEAGATGPLTSDKLVQLYRHGSRATVAKYLRRYLMKQAAKEGVLELGEFTMEIEPGVPLKKQVDAFVEHLEGAHSMPQAFGKKLPKRFKYGAKDALVILTEDKPTHMVMDQPWKDAFNDIRKSGAKQATAQQVFDIVADGIRRTPGMAESEKATRIARLHDEMFVELGLVPGQLYDVPRIFTWQEILGFITKRK